MARALMMEHFWTPPSLGMDLLVDFGFDDSNLLLVVGLLSCPCKWSEFCCGLWQGMSGGGWLALVDK